MKKFMDEDFLLQTSTAKQLYHRHASGMPIYDYHCHLPPQEVEQLGRRAWVGNQQVVVCT